jgi:nucleotide-binding universal stress UspA family protein
MIPQYKRVLVATDFSEHGNAAIPHAYALLAGGKGTVHLCHALEGPETPNPLYAHFSLERSRTASQRRAMKQALTLQLKALVPPGSGGRGGVKSVCAVIDAKGESDLGIHRLANSVRAEAIVVGSHGHTGLLRLLLGSVAERVLAKASVPVLVVRGRKTVRPTTKGRRKSPATRRG